MGLAADNRGRNLIRLSVTEAVWVALILMTTLVPALRLISKGESGLIVALVGAGLVLVPVSGLLAIKRLGIELHLAGTRIGKKLDLEAAFDISCLLLFSTLLTNELKVSVSDTLYASPKPFLAALDLLDGVLLVGISITYYWGRADLWSDLVGGVNSKNWKEVLLVLTGSLLALFAVAAIHKSLIDIPAQYANAMNYPQGEGPTLMWWARVVILTPIAEELFFRGVLFRLFQNLKPGSIVFLTGCLFGLSHLGRGLGVDYVVVALCCGLVLSLARLRSGTVIAPIILHAVLNAGITYNSPF